MIKAESYISKKGSHKIWLNVAASTSISDDMKDMGAIVLKAELVSIFKQLDTIDPEILLDALEIYTEDLKDD